MSMEILEKNWKEIIETVVKPLWVKEFASMYESCKLDYDDFESLAGLELTKAFKTFDSTQSNPFTFATNVIKRKAISEIRDCKRDKRRALSEAESLNCPISGDDDNKTERLFVIEDKKEDVDIVLSEERVGSYIKRMSNHQLRILILQLLGFNPDEIMEMLDMTRAKYNDFVNGMKRYENSKLLYQKGGFNK